MSVRDNDSETARWIQLQIRDKIEKFGHTVLCVGADVDRHKPPFAYTIGLGDNDEQGLPEVLVFGLTPDAAQPILNTLAARIRAEPTHDWYDTPLHEIAQLPLVLKRCTRLSVVPYAVQAIQYYEHRQMPWPRFAQLVLPDAGGLFPWQPGFDAKYMNPRQPRLYEAQA